MKVGTADSNIDKKKALLEARLRNRMGTGGGRNNPGGGGGGGNGGDGGGGKGGGNLPENKFPDVTENNPSNKLKVAMWFILLVVLMTFAGLIGAYILTATNKVLEWRPFDLPRPVLISTVLIIASSISYKIFQKNLNAGSQSAARNWLVATTVLGASFISSQILAWFSLWRSGVYAQSNPYAGFFYILTAIHAVHVAGGIAVLGYILLRTWLETDSPKELEQRKGIARSVGWYWHFMDGLWLVLFLLLGFYK